MSNSFFFSFCEGVTCNLRLTASSLATLSSKLIHFLLSSLSYSDLVWHLQKESKRKPTGVGSLVGDIVGLLSRLHNTLQLILWGDIHFAPAALCYRTTKKNLWDHWWNLPWSSFIIGWHSCLCAVTWEHSQLAALRLISITEGVPLKGKKRLHKIVFYKECIPSIENKMLHYQIDYLKH